MAGRRYRSVALVTRGDKDQQENNGIYCTVMAEFTEEELDLSLSPLKKASVKQGRRAGGHEDDESPTFEMSASPLKARPLSGDILLDPPPTKLKANANAPPRRAGGWADESSKAKPTQPEVDYPDERSQDSDDELPVIPDLEEVEKEDLALKVAEAPNVAVNRVDTYKELDNDLFKQAAFATLEEIDLRLLTRRLAPELALKEPDECWSWDKLYTDVSSEMQAEWFPVNTEEKKEDINERPYTAFNKFPV